jgi:D-alanyl-D-alanine carboxypeptidase
MSTSSPIASMIDRTCLQLVRWSMTSRLLAAFALFLAVLGGPKESPAQTDRDQTEARIQIVLDSLRAADGFPGATAAVVGPDGARYASATGWADREDSIRMTPDTRMLGGSTGKSFTAALILDLAQQNRLNLDAPVARWLGNRPWFSRLPNAHDLTLRILLRHQSGIIDHIHHRAFTDTMRYRRQAEGPDAFMEPEEVISLVLDTDPLFPAGTGYHYSDTNYILAGLVVEAATDRTYYDLLETRILDPMGLSRTAPANKRDVSGLAAGYIKGDPPFGLPRKILRNGALVYNPVTEWTGGGLVTNAQDLARWAHALYEGNALRGAYLEPLLNAVLKDSTQQARFGPEVQYGLGVTIRSTALGIGYGHRGWTPGYLSMFEYYPAHNLAVAVQVNALGRYDMPRYAVRLAAAVRRSIR